MKLKNIEKKSTFWYQYKGRIKEAVMEFLKILLILACTVVCCGLFYMFFTYGMLKEFVFTIYILYAIIVLYKTIMFYVHQQYLPLTQEELSRNNITTMEEYDIFLKKYLNNFEPVEKIKEMVYFNTFRYLYTHNQKLEYIKNKYEEYPEPLKLIKEIMDYELDYDVHKDDKFVSEIVHYYFCNKNRLNRFYFDNAPMNCLNLFVVVTVILLFVIFGFWVFATQEEQLYFFKYIFG